jgi:hypothetical protein
MTHFGGLMRTFMRALIGGVLLASSMVAIAQQRPPQLKTIPESINFIWKDVEQDFTSLAEAMPEDIGVLSLRRANSRTYGRLANR